MNKKIIIITILLTAFLSQPVLADLVGFGPADIYTSNKRNTLKIGEATLINGENTEKYGYFKIIKPFSHNQTFKPVTSQMKHCRVKCQECGWAGQRYEVITDYEYGDELKGKCLECQSEHLTFYEPIPRDEIQFISLSGTDNFELEKINDFTWKTTQKIEGKGICNINILYDCKKSYIKENENKRWEIHLRGTLQEESDAPMGVVGGIDLKVFVDFKFPLFIDYPKIVEKGENFTVKITYGPPDKSWTKIPTDVEVDFNGVSKTLDEKGTVVFTMPDSRYDYTYDIVAEGKNYLSAKKEISPGILKNKQESNFFSYFTDNPYIFIVIIVIVCLVAIAVWRVSTKPWYR